MDPYKVLGLAPNASDDEVKRAYRRLAKKYHPDANPGDKVAEQKMKEINSAYDAIVNHKPYGNASQQNSGYGAGYGGFNGGFDPFGFGFGGGQQYRQGGGSSQNSSNSYYQAARNYINFGRYAEAMNVLSGISKRDAEWFYLSALASAGLGNKIRAKEYAEKACQMDPNNLEYRRLLNNINSSANAYSQYSANQGYSRPGFRFGKFCLIYCIANALLGLCCRGGYGYYGGRFC